MSKKTLVLRDGDGNEYAETVKTKLYIKNVDNNGIISYTPTRFVTQEQLDDLTIEGATDVVTSAAVYVLDRTKDK